MNDPTRKPKKWDEKRKKGKPHERRTHTNSKFYNSAAWRRSRKTYIENLTQYQWNVITKLETEDKMYLLDKVPICERCLDLYLLGAYNTVETAKELDHINPINPDNALDTKGKYGNPIDQDNYQYLCPTHHSKKSNRDKKVIELREQ